MGSGGVLCALHLPHTFPQGPSSPPAGAPTSPPPLPRKPYRYPPYPCHPAGASGAPPACSAHASRVFVTHSHAPFAPVSTLNPHSPLPLPPHHHLTFRREQRAARLQRAEDSRSNVLRLDQDEINRIDDAFAAQMMVPNTTIRVDRAMLRRLKTGEVRFELL